MAENEIIAEIHRHREAVARQCDFEPARLIAYYRRLEQDRTDGDHPLIAHSSEEEEPILLREEPPLR